jgi:pimeloyl-ACP methyl ester carboxylesterase
MPTTTVNQEAVFYAQNEATTGTPVVFLHGAGGSHQGWWSAAQLLTGARVFALDLPAHGQSTGHGRNSVAAYADVVAGVLDALALPAAVLAGHSLGGGIALWLALHQPRRVQGLILAGTGARLRVHPDILQAAKEGRAVGSAPVLGGKASTTPRPASAAPEVVYGDWVACDTFDVMKELGGIHCPTLVIVGANDVMTPPKHAAYLASNIAGAQFVTIEGVGHSPMVEKPGETAVAMQGFIDSFQRVTPAT